MDAKKLQAPKTTVTSDFNAIDKATGNLYESIAIMAKRATQIGEEVRVEIQDKLQEFYTPGEVLEEVFENKEQIEISKFYESLPKPASMALQEWLEGETYFRRPEESQNS
jgi:DNA-directed RNA polymerase subunit K/omega